MPNITRAYRRLTLKIILQVILGSVVINATGNGIKTKVTSAAMLQLRSACELFENAAAYGGRAVKFLVSPRSHGENDAYNFSVAAFTTHVTEGSYHSK